MVRFRPPVPVIGWDGLTGGTESQGKDCAPGTIFKSLPLERVVTRLQGINLIAVLNFW